VLLLLSASLVPLTAKAQTESTQKWSIRSIIPDPLVIVDNAFVQPVYIPTPVRPVRLKSASLATLEGVGDGWCVAYVQANGFSGYSGNAVEWKRYINVASPSAGDAIVLREGGPIGHVAIVSAVSSQSLLLVEQNYEGRYIVSSRSIPLDYDRIVGFISPTTASVSQDTVR
jgi:hypothetical protein